MGNSTVFAKQKPKIQTGLRIPQNRYDEMNALSEEMGVSINCLALVLIDVGLRTVNLGTREALRSFLRNPPDTSE